MSTPITGLETANQNGIASLSEIASRPTAAVSKIVFMPFSLLFDSAAATARVWDSGLPLPTQSLLPLQNENQAVTALASRRVSAIRVSAVDAKRL
jgi:hypothetical protein